MQDYANAQFALYRRKCQNIAFLTAEGFKFERIRQNFNNMTFEQKAANADYVTKEVCKKPQYVEELARTSLDQVVTAANATSWCNMCHVISKLPEGPLKEQCMAIYTRSV